MSFTLNKGGIMAIVGKSGSGKTTVLKCIYGLEDLQGGSIEINGETVSGPSHNLIPGHRDMKLVSQDFYVLDNHSVEENIFDKMIGYSSDAKQKRADRLLRLLELQALKNTKARFLSSGQKQRVAIARALAIIPQLLLLDEPFSNLDKLLAEKLYSFIINEVKNKRTSVILITHLPEEALKYADNIAVMDEGKILQWGLKWEVYYKPKNSRLAGLLGDYNIIHKADLLPRSAHYKKSKLFLRPDKIKQSGHPQHADFTLEVLNSSFNGKCHEVLGETKSGRVVILYSPKPLVSGKHYFFSIIN